MVQSAGVVKCTYSISADGLDSTSKCSRYDTKHSDPIYPTPPLDMTQGQFFKRSLTGLNSEFSFS